MELEISRWDEDLAVDPKKEYQALVRSLNLTDGFGLFFVRCSPAYGEHLVTRVKEDIPQKKIEVLQLKTRTDDLYHEVNRLPNRGKINILFIAGLETSFLPYIKPGQGGQGDYYKEDSVPRVLGNLNLQRERFKEKFNICFVFLVRLFGLKYFIHRAPDFFDWRSGIFDFFTNSRFSEIQLLISEQEQSVKSKANLLLEQGEILIAENENEEAVATYKKLLDLLSQDAATWSERGKLMHDMNLYDAAMASYNRAIERDPNLYEAWHNRGDALYQSGRYEEAIASYNKAIESKPNSFEAWNNRGNALSNLGQYEIAVDSYNRSLEVQPNNHVTWFNRGNALAQQGLYKEAVTSYRKALEIKPDYHEAQNNLRDVQLNH